MVANQDNLSWAAEQRPCGPNFTNMPDNDNAGERLLTILVIAELTSS